MWQRAVSASGGGSTPELICNAQNSPTAPLTFSNKNGKKLILTLCMGWYQNVTDNYAKISAISGGTIIDTHELNSGTGSNAYYRARCYEIDVTSDSLSISIGASSVVYSAVFY